MTRWSLLLQTPSSSYTTSWDSTELDDRPSEQGSRLLAKSMIEWADLERGLRGLYGFCGCVMGERCDPEALVICEDCVGFYQLDRIEQQTKQGRLV